MFYALSSFISPRQQQHDNQAGEAGSNNNTVTVAVAGASAAEEAEEQEHHHAGAGKATPTISSTGAGWSVAGTAGTTHEERMQNSPQHSHGRVSLSSASASCAKTSNNNSNNSHRSKSPSSGSSPRRLRNPRGRGFAGGRRRAQDDASLTASSASSSMAASPSSSMAASPPSFDLPASDDSPGCAVAAAAAAGGGSSGGCLDVPAACEEDEAGSARTSTRGSRRGSSTRRGTNNTVLTTTSEEEEYQEGLATRRNRATCLATGTIHPVHPPAPPPQSGLHTHNSHHAAAAAISKPSLEKHHSSHNNSPSLSAAYPMGLGGRSSSQVSSSFYSANNGATGGGNSSVYSNNTTSSSWHSRLRGVVSGVWSMASTAATIAISPPHDGTSMSNHGPRDDGGFWRESTTDADTEMGADDEHALYGQPSQQQQQQHLFVQQSSAMMLSGAPMFATPQHRQGQSSQKQASMEKSGAKSKSVPSCHPLGPGATARVLPTAPLPMGTMRCPSMSWSPTHSEHGPTAGGGGVPPTTAAMARLRQQQQAQQCYPQQQQQQGGFGNGRRRPPTEGLLVAYGREQVFSAPALLLLAPFAGLVACLTFLDKDGWNWRASLERNVRRHVYGYQGAAFAILMMLGLECGGDRFVREAFNGVAQTKASRMFQRELAFIVLAGGIGLAAIENTLVSETSVFATAFGSYMIFAGTLHWASNLPSVMAIAFIWNGLQLIVVAWIGGSFVDGEWTSDWRGL